jgi:hypothetical protein
MAILLVTAASTLAVALDWRSPLRTVLALGFLLFVPGLALAELLVIREPVQRLAIATGASLGVETVLAATLIYARAFSLGLTLSLLAGLTVGALAVAVVRARHLYVSSCNRGPHA